MTTYGQNIKCGEFITKISSLGGDVSLKNGMEAHGHGRAEYMSLLRFLIVL